MEELKKYIYRKMEKVGFFFVKIFFGHVTNCVIAHTAETLCFSFVYTHLLQLDYHFELTWYMRIIFGHVFFHKWEFEMVLITLYVVTMV